MLKALNFSEKLSCCKVLTKSEYTYTSMFFFYTLEAAFKVVCPFQVLQVPVVDDGCKNITELILEV